MVIILNFIFSKAFFTCSSFNNDNLFIQNPGAACRLYFDLEFKTEFNPEKNGSKMVDIFIKVGN